MANETIFEAGDIEKMLDRTSLNIPIPDGMIGLLVGKPSGDTDDVSKFKRFGYEVFETKQGDLPDPTQVLMVIPKERWKAIQEHYVKQAKVMEAAKASDSISQASHVSDEVTVSEDSGMVATQPVSISQLGSELPDEKDVAARSLETIQERLAAAPELAAIAQD